MDKIAKKAAEAALAAAGRGQPIGNWGLPKSAVVGGPPGGGGTGLSPAPAKVLLK